MELREFLLARITEDEAVARAAAFHPPAEADAVRVVWYRHDTGWVPGARGEWAEGQALFEWCDPARVLAECDAKRRIVAWHRLIDGLDTEDNPVRGCGNCIASGAVSPYLIAGPCMTVRLLALPHADHPDYRAAWKP